MSVVNDLYCRHCNHEVKNERVDVDHLPKCDRCGHTMRVDMTGCRFSSDGDYMVYAPGIDADKKINLREARRIAAEKGMPLELKSAEKQHGSRNEDHLHLGRIYSGTGVSKRGSYDRAYGEFS